MGVNGRGRVRLGVTPTKKPGTRSHPTFSYQYMEGFRLSILNEIRAEQRAAMAEMEARLQAEMRTLRAQVMELQNHPGFRMISNSTNGQQS